MTWWGRLRKGKQLESELDAELRFHFQAQVDAHTRNGLPEWEARRRARLEFGGLDQVKETCRDARGTRWLDNATQDLRFSTRSLIRNRGFTCAVVLTVGLGVGATAAIFSVVYGVLLRPLPFANPEALVVVQAVPEPSTGTSLSPRRISAVELTDWVQRARTFESLALFSDDIFAVAGDTGHETVLGSYVSERFFQTLGQPMVVGRPPQGPAVPEAVVSYRFWQRRLGGDENVVGREIRMNGRGFTIAGVARPDFAFPTDDTDVWTSLGFAAPTVTGNRRTRVFALLGRLRADVDIDQARADAKAVARSLSADYPDSNGGFSATVVPLRDYLTGDVRPALVFLMAAVGFVLVVACANVANLLLVRRASRSREIAVRVALGASRSRLVRQLLAEGILLACAGAAFGLVIARAAVAVLLWLQPESLVGVRPDVLLPRLDAVRVDTAVLLFALAASTAVTLLATLVPAMQCAERAASEGLKSAAHTQTGGPATRRLRSTLVVAELAASLVLLIGAGLLARSFIQLLRTDVGAALDRVLTIEVNVAMGRTLPNARQIELADELLSRVRRLPNVEAAGVASMLPLKGVRMVFSTPMNQENGRSIEQRFGLVNPTPGYFQALGITLLNGRFFSDADGPSSPPVMILGSRMARRFFGSEDPIGRRLPYKDAPTIVGVVADVKYGGLADLPQEALYRPFAQQPFRNMFVVARSSDDPRVLAPDLGKAIHGLDPEVMIGPPRTLDAIMSDAIAQPRFRTLTLAAISTLALVLAAIGLYGVIAYSVSLRTTEIGIRMALGADAATVMTLILRESLVLATTGMAIGLGLAYALSRTIERFLYGVAPLDATSYTLAAGFMLLVMFTASYVPARRATGIDPLTALRAE